MNGPTRAPGAARRMALLLALLAVRPGLAATAQPPLVVRGRVDVQRPEGARPLPGVFVTLHRVSSRAAGPVDSVRSGADGRFTFRVPRPDTAAMYLASTQFAGIAYFSSPADAGAAREAGITVYDTTSGEVPLALQGRHLIVAAPDPRGRRAVIDVLEIQNDAIVTRVAGARDRPTFVVPLPASVTAARLGEAGDADSVAVDDGRAQVRTPLSPGLRQVVLTYRLDADAFPLRLALERPVAVLEVLLEGGSGTATGAGLASTGAVTVDGKTFARFLAQDAGATTAVTIAVPGRPWRDRVPPWALPVLLAGAVIGGIVLVARRAPPAPATRGPAVATAGAMAPLASLVGEVATLDALLASPHGVHPAARDAVVAHRSSRRAALEGLLADRTAVQ